MKSAMVAIATVLFAACFVGFVNAAELEYVPQEAVVTGVEDGNTVALHFLVDPEGVVRVAKLKGVVASWKGGDGACFAEASKKFLVDSVRGKRVTVEWDSQDKTDAKGRLLVYISYEGRDINAAVLYEGHGWVARMFPADREANYRVIELAARVAKSGLWGSCSAEFLKLRQ